VLSSPNHSTSDIEDAFSSNFSDYIPVSLDYVSASSRKTFSESSNNSSALVLIALPTLSLFHDDPYMKVMHAYYAKESPIPSPVIVPHSSMLSLIFNPQEFFLPEELLPLKKRGRNRSSSSTSALPQEFNIEESSRKTSLKCHKDQIEQILNHLDELSLDRIENIEYNIKGLGKGQVNKIVLARFRIADLEQIIKEIQARHQADKERPSHGIMPPKRTSSSSVPAMTQDAIRKLVANSVTAALEAQAATMTNTDNLNRNTGPRETHVAKRRNYKEFISYQPFYFNGTKGASWAHSLVRSDRISISHSNCVEKNKVTFATCTLIDDALSWWNAYAQPIGIEKANKITWTELKRRFRELAVLCPNMVPNTKKLMELFIEGLPQSIEGTVTASKPQTLEEAINMA
nr:hypothetical protein [Tanacetum cinerariifolium]